MSHGLLFSQMEPAPADEVEFHDWYDREHIPPRVALPGVDQAVRYVAAPRTPTQPPWHLACYFLSDMAALDTPAYQRIKREPGGRTEGILGRLQAFTRYIGDLHSDTGPITETPSRLQVVAYNVPDEDRDALDDWYDNEHVDMLMRADGWLRVRRYDVRPGGDGPKWTHLALHELRDEAALDAPERAAARGTAKRNALAGRDWFKASGRWLYRPVAVAGAAY